mgnify:CR=1 FL=1
MRTFGAGEQGEDDEDDEDDEDEGEAAEKEEASEARGSGESAAAARARKLADKRRRKKENAREKQRRALEEDALLQDRIREVEEEKLRQRIERRCRQPRPAGGIVRRYGDGGLRSSPRLTIVGGVPCSGAGTAPSADQMPLRR